MTAPDDNEIAVVLFSTVILLIGFDLWVDAGAGAGLDHLAAEVLAGCVAGLGILWFLRRALERWREAAAWRARSEELLSGIGHAVEAQLRAWRLSPAEGEVALLLLKGLSLEEIARVRGTSERKARTQARTVYGKAGVAGRAELSAWFIEDLLPPGQ